MVEFTYEIQDKMGMHARPAGALVQMAAKLDSKVTISVGDKKADCTKLIAMMRLGIKYKDVVTFRVEGEKEEEDSKALLAYCKNSF